MLVIEILRNTQGVLGKPLAQVLIAYTTSQYGTEGRGVRVIPFVFCFGDVLRNEAPLGVCACGVLRHWIHVHTEAVAYPSNPQVLIEAVLVAVFRQDADVTFTVGDLVLTRRVVGYVCVAHVLNVAHHAVIDGRYFHIGLVVRWDDFA